MPPPSKKISWYKKGKLVEVHDKTQKNYRYSLSMPYGDFSDQPEFQPELSPRTMLRMGVFEGKYLNDARQEFPSEWYTDARLTTTGKPDLQLNCFGIKSRQPLAEWRRKGWIYGSDPRGWFQWYCRFFIGRRDPQVDATQIRRWKSFKRHKGAIQKNCAPKDYECRPRQRQALLQWAYNPFF